ncbi:MAG TPA: type II toxin-antitoxin system RelE/ParE family toxin [Chthoniobacterales bacterium]|nr:type II toxin-antitoxin system RelE/ParE family toxin [Chthoniobacterales bacterium]
MRVIYHPDAEAELIEAAKFYQRRVPGLGAQFLNGVDHAISVISAAPGRWAVIEKDVRRYLIRRFPYAIYYRAHPDELRVLAFKHHRRHPDYWRYRITP